MKKILLILGSGIMFLGASAFIAIYIWIDVDVKKNISIAKEIYPGTAEDALIAYLSDSGNSPKNRTNVAIWTLGQINSKKAIPFLESLYLNDPEGNSCYGKHDSLLCQYEIHKAINAGKSNWWPLHGRLNK